MCVFLSITACMANQASDIKWKPNGEVVAPDGKTQSLEIQSAYDGVTHLDRTYILGFKINKEGINFPTLVVVSSNLAVVKYWAFENILSGVFIYKNKIHVNDMRGDVFILENEKWQKSDFVLPSRGKVIFSDKNNQIIVCTPASLLKEGSSDSGCYSINGNWKYSFFWQHTVPKVCGNSLFVFEEFKKGGVLKELSLANGEVLRAKKYEKAPQDICNLQ